MTDSSTHILGISAYYHDSAAALISDGKILAACQEERFSRVKNDASFPLESVRYCLEECGLDLSDIKYVVFYDKPFLKFERLLETLIFFSPRSHPVFIKAMPVWIKEKFFIKQQIRKSLKTLFPSASSLPALLFSSHHYSHAASAFYPGPYDSSAVLCMDGVGEWATTSTWLGSGNQLHPLWQIDFPHSLGLLYSAFTSFTGFRVNSGEYKLMGLAPYGEPRFEEMILSELIDVKTDGSFRLNMAYFGYCYSNRMTNKRFEKLFDGPAREPEAEITQREMDLAASVQKVIEEVVIRLCRHLQQQTGSINLSLAGGVALNCVANSKILEQTKFENIWVQPAAGDAGGAIGAAIAAWHQFLGLPREKLFDRDGMQGTYLGPEFKNDVVRLELDRINASYEILDDHTLMHETVRLLADKKIVGWFQGRMEFGPRALGARSILADPRDPSMQKKLNLSIKNRESFRPFAPAVLDSRREEYFRLKSSSPYMVLVAKVADDLKTGMDQPEPAGMSKLQKIRSTMPAITHVDYTARVQTVDGIYNPRFHRLLETFEELTGCAVLVNTSFNVRGEPIVCRPAEAYNCFMNTGMDCLVIGNLLLRKDAQPAKLPDASPDIVVTPANPDGQSTRSTLRNFGVSLAVLLVSVFGIFIPYLGQVEYPVWPWYPGLILLLLSLVLPDALAPVQKGWLALGRKLGLVMTPVVLTLIYCVMIVPLGLFLKRSLKKGAFAEIGKHQNTYFIDSDNPDAEDMRNPF